MKIVAETHHLQKRGDTWYYFRRVPKSLVPVLGKTFVKQSLGVQDLKSAKVLRNALNVKLDAEFAVAEQSKTAPGEPKLPPSISLGALTEYLRAHVERLDQRSAKRLTASPPGSEQQRTEMLADADFSAQILKNRDDPRGVEWTQATGDKIMAEAGASLSDEESLIQFYEIVRRGLVELQARRIDRLEDRYDRSHYDPLFDRARAPVVAFGELADIFWAERVEAYQLNRVSQKRIDKLAAELAFLREAVGEGAPVASIDDDLVQRIRSLLARLPANRTKLYPGLGIEAAIQRAEKEGRRVMEPTTQGRYLDCLRDVLAVGVRKGFLQANRAEAAKPIQKDKLAPSERRLPWTDEQIVGFFNGGFYRSCVPDAAEPYDKVDRAWRFWLPLLMLFSGARPNEITQLHLADVKQTTAGTWYLDLIETDDDEGKTLKTLTSRRRVPLHPELIKLGFLGFVERRKKQLGKTGSRLFPEIKPDKYGNTATYPARRFREAFIPAEISLSDRQTLYSLRHNVRDALRRAKAPPEALLAVTGWSPSGKAVSDHYGDPGNPDLHIEVVEKIAYPGLDLTFLHGVGTNV